MWTNMHLSVQVVWDQALYHATAIWQDDADSDPVTLTASGQTAVSPWDSPGAVWCAVADEISNRAASARSPLPGP